MVWKQPAQEGNRELSLHSAGKGAGRGNVLHVDWPPEEEVFAEPMEAVWFLRRPRLKGKLSDVTEGVTEFPGLQGVRGRLGGEGWGGVLVQNGGQCGDEG